MRVDERQHVILDAPLRLVGELAPARADIDARVLDAPQHRDRVRHVEVVLRIGVAANPAVVEVERRVVLAALDVEQRPVPPHVVGEVVARRPRRFGGVEPGQALGVAALHLHDMGHRVHRPDVRRVDLDGAAPGPLGAGVVAAFLETEGPHRKHVPVAGIGGVPRRQHAGHRIAQRARIAEIEMGEVGEPERDDVARPVEQDVLPQRRRPHQVARRPRLERGDMAPLALARRGCGRGAARGVEGGSDARVEPGVAEQQMEAALEHMRHHHPVVGRQRRLEALAGVAAKAEIGGDDLVVGARRGIAGGAHRQSEGIGGHRL